ncbi:MAG: hypothetical protein KIS79_10920 [Burkholderiales bacterium]|nr:hypothetical protein [Burkholderiales bacterium]
MLVDQRLEVVILAHRVGEPAQGHVVAVPVAGPQEGPGDIHADHGV